MKILVVDDDKIFCELLKTILIEHNHVIDIANNEQKVWDYIDIYPYDLIIIDIMLANLNGISFCHKLRAKGSQAPIMLLTSKDISNDKIKGLNAGADDYVVKSIPLSELEARIRALLRRKVTISTPVLVWGDLQLDSSKCEVKYNEVLLNLTVKEYKLLELFMQNSEKIQSQSTIISKLWSLEDEIRSIETVRTLVKRLRQKLKSVGAVDLIETVYGMGYRLNPVSQKLLTSEITSSIQNYKEEHFPQSKNTVNTVDVKFINPPVKPEAKIMVLDDDNITTRLVEALLEPWGLQVISLNDSQQFWNKLDSFAPDLLILDVQMPIKNGIELCQMIRNNSRWAWLPILFLTIHRDNETLQKIFAAGGDDYVSKPVVAPELITRIFNRLERTRLIREYMDTDALTSLPNRRRSSQDIDKFLNLAFQSKKPFCLAVIASDKLSQINRDYGHRNGEQILQKLAQLLRQELRNEDIISRWNGAEFIVGMYDITQIESEQMIAKVLKLVNDSEFDVLDMDKKNEFFVAGVAQYPDDGKDIQSLYRQAVLRLEKVSKS